ncbi:Bro-N domain-containing protein [Lacticaseibacillus brantae]|uniref:Bro-N domain-containing protein n=1 Tax=Lacticaseibacillus brantae DSM 23927 TaxID=1423727 RepID=A0A0R2B0D2_9LACO|nr:BRO family protein [Lacticaseibacillus brantae]KRM73041.1 hypothetical protein FC34_GL000762 [Lacticaseibacillus brantae DSM 23927]
MKIEKWNGYAIRFVEVDGEWWAVATDVTSALGLKQTSRAVNSLDPDGVTSSKVIDSMGRAQQANVINEFNIYKLVFKSKKAEAIEFQRWVFEVIKQLRKSSGLEGFEIFRMLDKEHQKQMMADLSRGLKRPVRLDFIKANTIANKAVSTKYGYPKMVKKAEMTPEMMLTRESILEDTTQLMSAKDKFGLDIRVAETIYAKQREAAQ